MIAGIVSETDLTPAALADLKLWAASMTRAGTAMTRFIEFAQHHGLPPNCKYPQRCERLRAEFEKASSEFAAAKFAFTSAIAETLGRENGI